MNEILYYLLALTVGFAHAFETDHLAAVSNLVSSKSNLRASTKDGVFWGLGHTSTILFFSVLVILLKFTIKNNIFSKFEILVGIMLISLGIYRLWKLIRKTQYNSNHHKSHYLAYLVGLVHGLAGSGTIILTVLMQMKSPASSILYLILFGIGSIFGMLVASFFMGNFVSLDSFKKYNINKLFSFLSAIFCIIYGNYVIYINLVT